MSPGPIATLALLLVIPGAIAAFSTLTPTRAVLAIFFCSLLFLPEKAFFDAPGVPPLDKQSIPAICILVGLLVKARDRLSAARLGRGPDVFWILAVVGTAATVVNNPDPLRYGAKLLPGYELSDFISELSFVVLRNVVPFLVGRAMIRNADDARDLLRAFVIGGVIYAPFILIELRLSPQWHNWIYGYGQHRFAQTVRGEGYRPMVFMTHGLALALFMWAAVFSAWTLHRARLEILGKPVQLVAWGLTLLFPFLKSLAAIIYGVVAVPFGARKPESQLRLALVIALIVGVYPILRTADLFPTKSLVTLAGYVSAERAESIEFRFLMEDRVLTKTYERPVFGWGTFGRNMVYTRFGDDNTIIDGAWLGTVSAFGIVGLVTRFAPLLWSILMARRRLSLVPPPDQPLLAAVAVLTAFYALDLLPNGLFNAIPMFLAGALTGLAKSMPEATNTASLGNLLAVLRQASPVARAHGSRTV